MACILAARHPGGLDNSMTIRQRTHTWRFGQYSPGAGSGALHRIPPPTRPVNASGCDPTLSETGKVRRTTAPNQLK